MRINKSLITNGVSVALVGVGYCIPDSHWSAKPIRTIGLYATSGAITNWIAIYMLFEKVPGFYGSGVIPNRFEEFKAGIRDLIMNQFFTHGNVESFFAADSSMVGMELDPEPILQGVDYDGVFQRLIDAILASQFGSMLAMFGGAKALQPLREPFEASLQAEIRAMVASPKFRESLMSMLQNDRGIDTIVSKVEGIVLKRLNELTPQMVKVIVQDMIRQHLGWLVVWGGVFGALIGLLAAWLESL